MPKEQGQSGERAARSTSKTAKDKSNSATLRASQGGVHRQPSGMGDVSNRMLRCDSEKDLDKDSGYSEAGSDSVHTDVDDQRSSVSEPHRESSSKSSTGNSVNISGHSMPPYEDLTPIYVIKNLVVKPSASEQLLHSPLPWAGGWHSLTNAKAPTQLLLIQQPTMATQQSSILSPTPGLATPQTQPKKGGGRSNQNHCSKNSYLPILNSYPRIAPHPRKESHESKGVVWPGGVKECGSECHSQSKRVCMEEEAREVVSTTSQLLKPQQHQKEAWIHSQSQHKSKGGHSSSLGPPPKHISSSSSSSSSCTQQKSYHSKQSSASDNLGSPSVSSSQTPSPPSSSSSDSPASYSPPSSSPNSSAAHSPYHLVPDSSSTRHRRFLNTAEILNQSGLLAITLQTKELLKQNNTVEREISQLRQHTHLLCQAAQACQNGCGEGLDCLEKLLRAMSDSNSYPSLDLNHLKVLGSNQQDRNRGEDDMVKETKNSKTNNSCAQMVSLRNLDDGTSPPSPLFAPSPDSDEKEHGATSLDAMSIPLSLPRASNEQGLRQAIMDKNLSDLTCMVPESSTCSDYLL